MFCVKWRGYFPPGNILAIISNNWEVWRGKMKKIILLFLVNLLFFVAIAHGQPVRIAYLQSDIHQLPCWVALEKGFFEKEGVKVEVAGIFKAGPELMSAFAAGALDMGYVGVAPATTAVANKTARVVVLAQVNTEGSAIVVKRDAPVQTKDEETHPKAPSIPPEPSAPDASDASWPCVSV